MLPRALTLAAGLLLLPTYAAAQAAVMKAPRDPKWTFEVMAGGALATAGGGSGGTPTFPAGEDFLTEEGRPSRAVPSWFFGDGAALFNDVRAQFAAAGQQFPQITPIDAALGSPGMERGAGPTFGARLTRRLTNRVALEFAFQRSAGTMELTDEARDAFESASDSFDAAFRGLFATMPQTGLEVSSTTTLPSGVSGAQRAITGALKFTLTRGGRLETYVVAGAGHVANSGTSAQARLRGSYQFRFLDTYAFSEVDNVTVNYSQKESMIVGVGGAGLMFDLGRRYGIRLDVRVHAGDSSSTTTLSANPTVNTASPTLALPSITTPSIQFSNTAAAKSSLSGKLTETEVFTGSGLETRVLATAGVYFRF